MEYDWMNREVKRIEKDGSVIRSYYNLNGQLQRQTGPNRKEGEEEGDYRYTYDP